MMCQTNLDLFWKANDLFLKDYEAYKKAKEAWKTHLKNCPECAKHLKVSADSLLDAIKESDATDSWDYTNI